MVVSGPCGDLGSRSSVLHPDGLPVRPHSRSNPTAGILNTRLVPHPNPAFLYIMYRHMPLWISSALHTMFAVGQLFWWSIKVVASQPVFPSLVLIQLLHPPPPFPALAKWVPLVTSLLSMIFLMEP
jgi:hypothetical protein